MTWWFVLPRFGSCKTTPRWGGHKDRVSFNPFPLSNGHLDRVSFSSQSNGTLSPYKDHHTIGVSCLGYNWVGIKKEWRRKAIQAQELKRTQLSLSLVTNWLEWSLDLGEDLISCLRLVLNAIALVWGVKAENLDAMNGGCVAVTVRCAFWLCSDFCAHCSALTAVADDRWRCVAVTPLAHRTVRCYTGQSGEL
jgi:hypothetical protein